MIMAGRSLWAELHLLDRQLLDTDRRPVAKVDDLELSEAARGDLPVVTALLCGPAALGRRFGPRTGALLEAFRGLLRDEPHAEPLAISMDLVQDIGPAITLRATRESLPVTDVERFLGDHLVAHIPGSGEPGPADQKSEES
jgi:hypothetical protein